MRHKIQKIFFDGPAGKLETEFIEPDNNQRGLAVIAHPHPLFGGTMNNKVVHTLFKALSTLGYISVKFNFRSVGQSEGIHDHGTGEINDVVAVTNAIQTHFACKKKELLLAGFSFGGAIQTHAARLLNPQYLILIAPSVINQNAPPVDKHCKNVLVIHGSKDQIVPLQDVLNWAEPQSLPVIVLPGTEHFFHGNLLTLKQIIFQYWNYSSDHL